MEVARAQKEMLVRIRVMFIAEIVAHGQGFGAVSTRSADVYKRDSAGVAPNAVSVVIMRSHARANPSQSTGVSQRRGSFLGASALREHHVY